MKIKRLLKISFDAIICADESIDYSIEFNDDDGFAEAYISMDDATTAVRQLLTKLIRRMNRGYYDHPKYYQEVVELMRWLHSDDVCKEIWDNNKIQWNQPPTRTGQVLNYSRKHRLLRGAWLNYEHQVLLPYYISTIHELKIGIPTLPEDNICDIMSFINLGYCKKKLDSAVYSI